MRRSLFLLAGFVLTSAAFAGPPASPADAAVEPRQAVDLLTEQVAAHYVVAKLRQPIVDRVATALAAGAYDGLDPAGLARAVTADMFAVSHDRHLKLSYAPERFAALTAGSDDDPAAIAAYWHGIMARDNAGIESFEWLPGGVAYMRLGSFWAEPEAYAKMNALVTLMEDARAVIFDLRDNRGGDSAMVQYMTSLFIDDPEPRVIGTYYDGMTDVTRQEQSLTYMPVHKMADTPLYVLTSGRTFSAGEAFAQQVRAFKLGTLVGEVTAGAAYTVEDVPLAAGMVLRLSTGVFTHPITGSSWEGVGVVPHVATDPEDALSVARHLAYQKVAESAADEAEQRRYRLLAEEERAAIDARPKSDP